MDARNPNKEIRNTPEYAEYQRDNFWASNDGKVPPFNTGKGSFEAIKQEMYSPLTDPNNKIPAN